MASKRILSGATAAALVLASAGLVQAQQDAATAPAGAAGLREAEDESLIVQPFNVSIDDLEDMDVFTPAGEEIGEVDEVLVDAAGNVVAVAIEAGGFLGMGDKRVVVGLDRLRLENQRLVTEMTKEQLEALPEWDD